MLQSDALMRVAQVVLTLSVPVEQALSCHCVQLSLIRQPLGAWHCGGREGPHTGLAAPALLTEPAALCTAWFRR